MPRSLLQEVLGFTLTDVTLGEGAYRYPSEGFVSVSRFLGGIGLGIATNASVLFVISRWANDVDRWFSVEFRPHVIDIAAPPPFLSSIL